VKFQCVADHFIDIDGGQIVYPHDEVDLDPEVAAMPHQQALINAGLLEQLDDGGASLKDLQYRAKELDIEGRSSMNKEQLAEAIVTAETQPANEEES
jgi:hypothetical protein